MAKKEKKQLEKTEEKNESNLYYTPGHYLENYISLFFDVEEKKFDFSNSEKIINDIRKSKDEFKKLFYQKNLPIIEKIFFPETKKDFEFLMWDDDNPDLKDLKLYLNNNGDYNTNNFYKNIFRVLSITFLEDLFSNDVSCFIASNTKEKVLKNSEFELNQSMDLINDVISIINQNIQYTLKKSDNEFYVDLKTAYFDNYETLRAVIQIHMPDLNWKSYYILMKKNNEYYLLPSEYTSLTNIKFTVNKQFICPNSFYIFDGLMIPNPLIEKWDVKTKEIKTEYTFIEKPLYKNYMLKGENLFELQKKIKFHLMDVINKYLNIINKDLFEKEKSIFINKFRSYLDYLIRDTYNNISYEVIYDKYENKKEDEIKNTRTKVTTLSNSIDGTSLDLIIELKKDKVEGETREIHGQYCLKIFNNGFLSNFSTVFLTTDFSLATFIPTTDPVTNEKIFLPDISKSENHFNLMKKINKNPNYFKYKTSSMNVKNILEEIQRQKEIKNYSISDEKTDHGLYQYQLDNEPEYFVESMLTDFHKYIFNRQY